MPKSIHFAQVPDMRGKLSMRFTDVDAVDLRPALRRKMAEREMRDDREPDWSPHEDPTLGWFILEKVSAPGWEKGIDSHADMIDELRRHICEECLLDPFDGRAAPDVVVDGRRYECRDADVLLGTPCGCEFSVVP